MKNQNETGSRGGGFLGFLILLIVLGTVRYVAKEYSRGVRNKQFHAQWNKKKTVQNKVKHRMTNGGFRR